MRVRWRGLFGARSNNFKEKYKKGEIGDVAIKKVLIDSLNNFLDPIRKKRKEYEEDPKILGKILSEGNEKTRAEAQETLRLAHKAMNYYYNDIFSF